MNTLKTTFGMAMLFVIFMALGQRLGGRYGMEFGLIFAFVINMGAYWFSDKIALAMSGAIPVAESEAPELYKIVRRLSENAKIPTPRIYRIPQMQPNAFATGRDPGHSAIALTEGLVQVMSRRELEGVIAHELSHIRNRDTLTAAIAATFAAAISNLAIILMWTSGDDDDNNNGGNIFGLFAVAILLPLVAMIIQLSISRAREFEADRGAAQITGEPMGLARALGNIEILAQRTPMPVNAATTHMYIMNPQVKGAMRGIGRGIANAFSTHPPTSERIARLEKMAREMKNE